MADQAARQLDRQTWSRAWTDLVVDRELAFGVAQIWDRDLYRKLGHVRAIDYAYDELGLKEGKARKLAQLGRGLAAVPELDAAFLCGRLGASHVISLLRVLDTKSSEDARRQWIERAAPLTVEALKSAVRVELDRRKRESGKRGDAAAEEETCAGGGVDSEPIEHTVPASNLDQLQPGVSILDPDAPEEGDWVSMPVPARVGEIWSTAVNLARQVGGRHAPHHQCAEWIAGDYLARVGDEDPEQAERREQEYRRQRCIAALGRLMQRKPRRQNLLDIIEASGLNYTIAPASEHDEAEPPLRHAAGSSPSRWRAWLAAQGSLGREPLQPADRLAQAHDCEALTPADRLGVLHGCEATPAADRPGLQPPDGDGRHALNPATGAAFDLRDLAALDRRDRVDHAADVWQLAAILARLIERKRRLRLELGERLDRLERTRALERLGFTDLEHYCQEHLGICGKEGKDLSHFFRLLQRYRHLRRAYLQGKLSYTAVRSILRVVHPSTELLWIEWARGLSCREIDANVDDAATYILPGADRAVLRSYAERIANQSASAGPICATTSGVNRPRESANATNAFAAASPNTTSPTNGSGRATSAATANAFAAASLLDSGAKVPPTNGNGSHGGNGWTNANAFAAHASPAPVPFGWQLGASAFAAQASTPALGWPLPPTSRRGRVRIIGLEHAVSQLPGRLVARIRFWAPADVLFLLRRALRRCRDLLEPPGTIPRPDWCFLEVILVQFIMEHDTPISRRFRRDHPILDRDNFWCRIPGCTSRARLEAHHIWWRGRQGPDNPWNQLAICKGHHDLIHKGLIELGGWAPWALYVRMGVHPESKTAFASYKNGRRAPEHEVNACLDRWRAWCRQRKEGSQPSTGKSRSRPTSHRRLQREAEMRSRQHRVTSDPGDAVPTGGSPSRSRLMALSAT